MTRNDLQRAMDWATRKMTVVAGGIGSIGDRRVKSRGKGQLCPRATDDARMAINFVALLISQKYRRQLDV